MNLLVLGDIHGNIKSTYDKIDNFINLHNIEIDWVLQVGNFGVWPDPRRIDRATRRHKNQIDFFKYYLNSAPLPYQTLFVQGKHEDHKWLQFMYSRGQLEILPNLNWLLNGYKTQISNGQTLSVVGLGKVYSPITYRGDKVKSGTYTRNEVERACSQGPTDLLLTHEAGKGAQIGNHRSEAEGINNICFAIRPKLHIHGHYNKTLIYHNQATGTPTLSVAFNDFQIVAYRDEKFKLLDLTMNK